MYAEFFGFRERPFGKTPDPASSLAPYRIFNIGNEEPVALLRYIEVLEQALGRTAEKRLLPMQPGDVAETWADTSALVRDLKYSPATTIDVGVRRFVDWYLDFYGADRAD